MGCPDQAILGQNLPFWIQAFDTSGSPVDADALPTYSIYEEETDTAIVTGTMSKQDDAQTTGFYSELAAITSANGFELWKGYVIRYVAAIGGTAVAKTDTFNVVSTALAATTTTGALTSTANYKDYANITVTTYDSLIANLISRATSAIEKYCDRMLRSTTYREFYDGPGDYHLYANEYPITDITLLAVGRQQVIRVNNSSSDAWNAHLTVDATNMTLTVNGGTNDGNDQLTLASYTVSTLVTAINALGKSWSATSQNANWDNWEGAELIPCAALSCFDNDYAYAETPYEAEHDFKFESDTGRIYLGTGFPVGRQNVTLRYTAGYATTPADLEQICIDLVNTYFRSRTTDSTVKSERLGDHWITYGESGGGGARDIPDHIAKRLAPYRKMRIAV